MKPKILLLILTVIAVSYCSCKKETKCVDGNGDIVQESRTVGNFTSVVLSGDYNASLHMRPDTDVDLFAESNIIPLIQTETSNETLFVKVEDGRCYNTNNTVEVSIANPTFKNITFNGSGTLKSNNLVLNSLSCILNGSGSFESGLEISDFILNISGSGNATMVGNGVKSEITITGTGNVYATNFVQETVYITISGSGDVRVYVTKLLNVTITGSGSVYYKGNPEDVITSITGTGTVMPI